MELCVEPAIGGVMLREFCSGVVPHSAHDSRVDMLDSPAIHCDGRHRVYALLDIADSLELPPVHLTKESERDRCQIAMTNFTCWWHYVRPRRSTFVFLVQSFC
jgi:hypothetical protein